MGIRTPQASHICSMPFFTASTPMRRICGHGARAHVDVHNPLGQTGDKGRVSRTRARAPYRVPQRSCGVAAEPDGSACARRRAGGRCRCGRLLRGCRRLGRGGGRERADGRRPLLRCRCNHHDATWQEHSRQRLCARQGRRQRAAAAQRPLRRRERHAADHVREKTRGLMMSEMLSE